MIYIKGKIKDYASNQSDLDKTNDLSKSALDRSSRSILDEYQQKFENNQAILQGYIDVLKNLSEKVSSIGDSVQKQYEWLRNQDFIPATEGGQEALDDIGEKLCQTMGDDGNGNPGCNVTLEQIDDFTDCIATGDGSGCDNTCDSHIQMCVDIGEGSCQTACEAVCQDNCESQCQATTEGTTEGACNLLADKCPTLEDVLRECGQCLGVCVGPGENCSELCDAIGDDSCTSYGQDNWCGLLESNCGTLGDTFNCVSLGDYSGDTCYEVGEMNCSWQGEKYCTMPGEQFCNHSGELYCLYPGERQCLFEGEDTFYCDTTVDIYMCDNSADGPDVCYDTGQANCKYPGEKYCREPGEKFYCFFYEDNACTSIGDQELICKYYDDESYSWCEQEVVDACGIPFKNCSNSAECPAEYGSNAGCGEYEGCGYCQANCLDCGLSAGPCQSCGQDGFCQTCGLDAAHCQSCGLDAAHCQSCGLSSYSCQSCGQDGHCQACGLDGQCQSCGLSGASCQSCGQEGHCQTCGEGGVPCQVCGQDGHCENCEGACTICDQPCLGSDCQRCEDSSCHDGCTSTGQCCEGCTGECQGECVSSCHAGTHCDPYVWICTSPSES